ncbi:MAG: hypothetical protein ACK2U1_18200 [Anaerolineales bacterium]|jgi:hypothetical protein
MDEHPTEPGFNPEDNQPSKQQWILIAVVALIAVCGLLLFLSGGVLTAYSWYSEQQAEAIETAAAATEVVVARDQAMIAASEWPVLLFDTFDDNRNDWIDGEIDDQYAAIHVTINGVYQWETSAKQGFHWRVWPESDLVSDFYLAVDAQNIGDNVDAQYGLIFRENNDSYFYWEVSDTQYYRLFSYQGDWIELIPSTFTEALQPGALNHLVVVAENDVFKLWINDQFVGQTSGSIPSKGQAGIAVGLSYPGEESVIIFDNFELRALSSEQ